MYMVMKNPAILFLKSAFLALTITHALPSLAATGIPDIGQMFANLSSSSITLMKLVSGCAFVAGIFLAYRSAVAFKEYADGGGRTQLKTPFGIMLAATLMIAFPGTINMATETLSLGQNTGSILSEGGGGGGGAVGMMSAALTGVLLFVKLVGHIAIFRGILMLKKIAEGQQGAEVGRALTHIFGGAAAVNINATINLLANSVGMSLPI